MRLFWWISNILILFWIFFKRTRKCSWRWFYVRKRKRMTLHVVLWRKLTDFEKCQDFPKRFEFIITMGQILLAYTVLVNNAKQDVQSVADNNCCWLTFFTVEKVSNHLFNILKIWKLVKSKNAKNLDKTYWNLKSQNIWGKKKIKNFEFRILRKEKKNSKQLEFWKFW